MKVLITGRGSIAQRHAMWLKRLVRGVELGVVSSTPELAGELVGATRFESTDQGLAWGAQAAVIASASAHHAHDWQTCLAKSIPCLVEKPAVTNWAQWQGVSQGLAQLAHHRLGQTAVGCNLRQLPALQQLRSWISEGRLGRVVRAEFSVGQDLRQWRPGRDLAAGYSANASAGGGALFDLVHELDMALFLLGAMQPMAALGGQFSDLGIQSHDSFCGLLKLPHGQPVSVGMDYVAQRPYRTGRVVGSKASASFDLIAKSLRLDGESDSVMLDDPAQFDVADTYRLQMLDWLSAMGNVNHELQCSASDGMQTSRLMLELHDLVSPP
jgi:predicted dehydrogenase